MPAQPEFQALIEAVIGGDGPAAREAADRLVAAGTSPLRILNEGMLVAMRSVGEKWKANEIFLPEVLMAVEAWKSANEAVEPHLSADARRDSKQGVVVIGTVKGDIHEIGKNIVATLLKTAGFEVHDLGKDLHASTFVSEAERLGADIIAASALMTTTMPYLKDVVEYLQSKQKRSRFFYLIGGAPVSQELALSIGADAFGKTAEDGVRLALEAIAARKLRIQSN